MELLGPKDDAGEALELGITAMRLEISESQKNSSRNLHTLINIWDIVLHKMRCCEIPSDVLSECFTQFSTIVLESAVDWILVKLRLRKCLEDVCRKVWWVNRRVCLAHIRLCE